MRIRAAFFVCSIFFLEDFRFGKAELVDTLLHIAHHKKIVGSFYTVDQCFLYDIVVLIFIYEDMFKLGPVKVRRLIIFEDLVGIMLNIAEIHHILLFFFSSVQTVIPAQQFFQVKSRLISCLHLLAQIFF